MRLEMGASQVGDWLKGRRPGDPVDCRPALRQKNFRGKYELSLYLSLWRYSGYVHQVESTCDPAVHNPRDLLVAPTVTQGEKHSDSSSDRRQGWTGWCPAECWLRKDSVAGGVGGTRTERTVGVSLRAAYSRVDSSNSMVFPSLTFP